MNKKGDVFNGAFVIVIFILVTYSAATIVFKLQDYTTHIGRVQFDLMQSYETGEVVLHYIDSSIRDAAQEAIDVSGCGIYLDYPLWFTDTKSCVPQVSDMEIEVKPYFKEFSEQGIPNVAYTLALDEGNVYAQPDDRLKVLISRDQDLVCCKTSIQGVDEPIYDVVPDNESCMLDNTGPGSTYVTRQIVPDSQCLGQEGEPVVLKASDDFRVGGGDVPDDPDDQPGPIEEVDFVSPIEGTRTMTSCFENRYNYCDYCRPIEHHGIDIGVVVGTEVRAVETGEVVMAQFTGLGGNEVILEHDYGDLKLYSRYAHLDNFFISVGDTVSQGDIIAESGCSGNAKTPDGGCAAHLHFEIRGVENRWDHAINPYCLDPQMFDDYRRFDKDYCHGQEEGFPCDWQHGYVWDQVRGHFE